MVPAARRAHPKTVVAVKRVYDDATGADGTRVLVDRVWPRGMRKDAAAVDRWLREVAPSTELRRWYGHDPDRFAEFTRRYREELAQPQPAQALEELREIAGNGELTLLTATRDPDRSQAAVLAELLS